MNQYLAQNHLDEFDWLFKADDDTYVCFPRLRQFLQYYDPNLEWYIGQSYLVWYPKMYNTGGSGVAFSRRLVQKINETDEDVLEFNKSDDDDYHLGEMLAK